MKFVFFTLFLCLVGLLCLVRLRAFCSRSFSRLFFSKFHNYKLDSKLTRLFFPVFFQSCFVSLKSLKFLRFLFCVKNFSSKNSSSNIYYIERNRIKNYNRKIIYVCGFICGGGLHDDKG